MFDIVSFGSASFDVIIPLKKKTPFFNKKRKGIFLSLGEKIEEERCFFSSGGGGSNAAATFVNFGLKTAFCGMIGNDLCGKYVLEDIQEKGINTDFVFKTDKAETSSSVIFIVGTDKIIFPFRGASSFLKIEDIPFKQLKAKWFYLAPLSGFLSRDFVKIIDFAKENNIKIAINPGKYQLSHKKEIKKALKKADIAFLNYQESSFLLKNRFRKEKEVFNNLRKLVGGICVMTRRERGSLVFDGKFIYEAPALKIKVKDPTGAGDAFSSGFLVDYIQNKNIVSAIQFATANAAANLKVLGAKEGILKKGDSFKKVKVKVTKFNET